MVDRNRLREAIFLGRWLKGDGIAVSLSAWVVNLLPPEPIVVYLGGKETELTVPQWLRYAAIYGTQFGRDVKVGQVSFERVPAHTTFMVHFSTVEEAVRLQQFADECYLSVPASVVRTAIMMGMKLPRVGDGVMSSTRDTPLRAQEVQVIAQRAYELGARQPRHG